MLEALYVDMLSVAQHKHIITVIGEFRERAHKATGVWMMIYMILLCVLANVYLMFIRYPRCGAAWFMVYGIYFLAHTFELS